MKEITLEKFDPPGPAFHGHSRSLDSTRTDRRPINVP